MPLNSGLSEERQGYFYEAMLSLVLDSVEPAIDHSMHVALQGMHVVSDIVVGPITDPKYVVLVTHSLAESGTNMKFWRNIQEILEIRENYPNAKIINVIFPSNWKANLFPLMETAADFQILIPPEIEQQFLALALQAIAINARTPDQYKIWLQENEFNISDAMNFLTSRVVEILNSQLAHSYWTMYQKPRDSATAINYSEDTYFKKGLTRLSLLSHDELVLLISNRSRLEMLPEIVLRKLISLGILTRLVGIVTRYAISEPIRYVMDNLAQERIMSILDMTKDYHSDYIETLLLPLQGVEGLDLFSFIEQLEIHRNLDDFQGFLFGQLISWHVNNPDKRNLPLDYLYIIAKELNPKFSHRILSDYCGLPMIGGVSPIPRFLYGSGDLDEIQVMQISQYFAELLSLQGIPASRNLGKKLVDQIEDKIMKHKYINYLVYACVHHCLTNGIDVLNPDAPMVEIGNGLADYCREILGIDIPANVVNTQFSFEATYDGDEYIFLVISAYDATHKHKEYPARWRCAQLEFGPNGFCWNTSSPKCVIILDGIWSQLFGDLSASLQSFNLPGIRAVYDAKTFLRQDPRILLKL